MASNKTWDKLNDQQRCDLQAMNDRIVDYFIAEKKRFRNEHPELVISLDLTLSAYYFSEPGER